VARLPVEHVECFHLILLRLLEARLDRSQWVVKGGVNLRAWFGSHRYSEDLDIDVVKGQAHLLRERVDRLLASGTFANLLAVQGLRLVRSTKPKQTDTTQRWKFQIVGEGVSVPIPTRVEFSRRGTGGEEYVLEAARPEILRLYGLPAPTVNHYTAQAAVSHKIQALALRAETQARDVWDLDHLLRTAAVGLDGLSPVVRKLIPQAVERAVFLRYEMYKSQVVPFLTPEDQEVYGTADSWDRMRELVVDRLEAAE
jgi:predicted nucleotidyltransferase component of viral defense system